MIGILQDQHQDPLTISSQYSVRLNMGNNPKFEDLVERVNSHLKQEAAVSSTARAKVPIPNTLSPSQPSVNSSPLTCQIYYSKSPNLQIVQSLPYMEFVLWVTGGEEIETKANKSLSLTLTYRSDLFSKTRAIEILNQLQLVLTQVSNKIDLPVLKLSLLTEAAMQVVPKPSEALDNTWFGSIHSHFSANAKKYPNKIALVHHQQSLTYYQLEVLTNRLANYLIHCGIQPEDPVFIFGHRNMSMVWAVMGILKSGACVSLMDPAYPAPRIVNCMQVAQLRGWVSISAAGSTPEEVKAYIKETRCKVELSLPLPHEALLSNFLGEFSSEFPNVPIAQDNVAVITFTSGSTGLPKGVLGRHGPLTHFYPWMQDRFDLSDKDHFSLCSGISHDPLQRDIFTPLFFGATLHIPNNADITNPGQLAIWMRDSGLTVTHLTPAMGQLLSETAKGNVTIPSLRLSLLVGDKLTKRDVRRLRKVAPNLVIVNMYGSTETQRAVSYFQVPTGKEFENLKEILPAGSGMKDVELLIFNAGFQFAGIGELGEIYVRSPHLAKGYKDLEDQTTAKFLQNPYRSHDTSDRMYRTGDLGRYMCDGRVEMSGRADSQVKIRGFRIELGEINTVLAQHPAVKENVPMIREDVPGEKKIVAYVVPRDIDSDSAPIALHLRRFLQDKLPHYMIPSVFVTINCLPLTPNGKINYGALPIPSSATSDLPSQVSPGNGIPSSDSQHLKDSNGTSWVNEEEEIAQIWSQLLGISTHSFGRDDNFFELGAHSLLATQLVLQLRLKYEVDVPMELLLHNPTVSSLSSSLRRFLADPTSHTSHQLIDLELEAKLDPSIRVPENARYSGVNNNILLTGATGFVGIFLLKELLEQTPAQTKVYCLVRCENQMHGKDRILQNLKAYRIWKEKYEDRIIAIPGDLSKSQLGVAPEIWEHLCHTIDCIIHNGALVHWVYPYAQLKAHNVCGSKEIIRLAATSTVKAVHYVSTTSVFDSDTNKNVNMVIQENEELVNWRRLEGGYPQSKWVAEKLFWHARTLGIPVNIYRPGYVSGDTVNGIWTTDDFLCRFIKGCIQLEHFPEMDNTCFDICPVDFVSKSIVYISQRTQLLNQSFNVINNYKLNLNAFFEVGKRIGYTLQMISYPRWRNLLLQSHRKQMSIALEPVISVFTEEYLDSLQHAKYENANLLEALKDSGILCPSLDLFIPLYYSYFIRAQFISAPSEIEEEFAIKYNILQRYTDKHHESRAAGDSNRNGIGNGNGSVHRSTQEPGQSENVMTLQLVTRTNRMSTQPTRLRGRDKEMNDSMFSS